MAVKPVPEGYHTVTPYLICKGAAAAIDYYKKAFGATELTRHGAPDGKIGHAEIKIGDSVIMLADEFPEMKALSPTTIGGTPVSLMLYVSDVDAVFKRALAGGRQAAPSAGGPVLRRSQRDARSTPSATCGRSPPTTRTSRRRRWSGGPQASMKAMKESGGG